MQRQREQLVKQKRLRVGVQTGLREAFAGEARSADIARMVGAESGTGSDESEEEAGERTNGDPAAEARVAEAIRLEEAGRVRRAARARLLAERGAARRLGARGQRRREGRKERRGRRRRERGTEEGRQRRGRAEGAGRARKRRRVIGDTDSESDSEEAAVQDTGAGGAVPATLAAGRLAQGAGASGAGDSAGFSFSSGSGGERHQAAVAEARRHLGGGGKRGWLE